MAFFNSTIFKEILSTFAIMKFGLLILKILLIPFSFIYWIISGFHHFSYSKGWKKSVKFNLPVINIGNLNTGGTGKTPHVSFINEILSEDHTIAILSRGYGRKSRGFIEVNLNDHSEEVGDEPLLLKLRHPNTPVFVGEERVLAIPQILDLYPETDLIILDDAFQHRRIRPSHQILLTCYDDLYSNDFPLPSGRLREPKVGAHRADVVMITKSPHSLDHQELKALRKELKLLDQQALFYSQIQYGIPYKLLKPTDCQSIDSFEHIHLICGIASPQYIIQYLEQHNLNYHSTILRDHSFFSNHLLQTLEDELKRDTSLSILVTEKDAVRLIYQLNQFPNLSERIFVLPISIVIGPDDAEFKQLIQSWV